MHSQALESQIKYFTLQQGVDYLTHEIAGNSKEQLTSHTSSSSILIGNIGLQCLPELFNIQE